MESHPWARKRLIRTFETSPKNKCELVKMLSVFNMDPTKELLSQESTLVTLDICKVFAETFIIILTY